MFPKQNTVAIKKSVFNNVIFNFCIYHKDKTFKFKIVASL